MRGVINVANLLRTMDIKHEIIKAAINQIFVGAAQQFPYPEPDYFQHLVYQRNPGLLALNEEILKIFK
jgi:hypothetical protein